jgi:transcription elongation factor S-II
MIKQEVRNKIQHEFSKMLGKDIAIIVEQSVYQFSEEYAEYNSTPYLLEQIYTSKAEELLSTIGKNLKFILDSIKSNTIDPTKIAYMRPSDLNMDQYSDIIKKQSMIKKQSSSQAFECDKCHKRNTQVEERQVKSGDEPTTLFITCLECGNVFTIE